MSRKSISTNLRRLTACGVLTLALVVAFCIIAAFVGSVSVHGIERTLMDPIDGVRQRVFPSRVEVISPRIGDPGPRVQATQEVRVPVVPEIESKE